MSRMLSAQLNGRITCNGDVILWAAVLCQDLIVPWQRCAGCVAKFDLWTSDGDLEPLLPVHGKQGLQN